MAKEKFILEAGLVGINLEIFVHEDGFSIKETYNRDNGTFITFEQIEELNNIGQKEQLKNRNYGQKYIKKEY